MSSATTQSEQVLDEFRTLIENRSGIHFDASRERFFSTRIRKHLQEKKLGGFDELMQLVLSSRGEYNALLQRLLTQETSFFRYPAAFEALRKKVLPDISARKLRQKSRTLRIWSAGCATGEEPYSIAITFAENLPPAEAWQIEILATDISFDALSHAARGLYSAASLGNLSREQNSRHFIPVKDHFQVKPTVQGLVKFLSMNLAESFYLGRLDCIFCMNVLMYFSEKRRLSVFQRLYECLEPGGYLLLGHSESLAKVPVKFERVVFDNYLLYRKPAAGDARSEGVEGES